MCTPQLLVESPLSWEKDTPAESPRIVVSDVTEPESLGQPEPEKTRRVIVGGVGGAATARSARLRNGRMRECIFFLLFFFTFGVGRHDEKGGGREEKEMMVKAVCERSKRMERMNVSSFWYCLVSKLDR